MTLSNERAPLPRWPHPDAGDTFLGTVSHGHDVGDVYLMDGAPGELLLRLGSAEDCVVDTRESWLPGVAGADSPHSPMYRAASALYAAHQARTRAPLPPGFVALPDAEPSPLGRLSEPPQAEYTPSARGGSLRLNPQARRTMLPGAAYVTVSFNAATCELLLTPDAGGRPLLRVRDGGSVIVSLAGLPVAPLSAQAATPQALPGGGVLVRLLAPTSLHPRPVWPHSGERSIFLGHVPFQGEQSDVYLEPRGALPWRSLLIRFGPGPNYTSGPEADLQRFVDTYNGGIGEERTRAAYAAALALLAAYDNGTIL